MTKIATGVMTKTAGGVGLTTQIVAIELWAFDSPEANGRKPVVGDVSYSFDVPLQNEGIVARIHISMAGAQAFVEHFKQLISEDAT